MMLTPERLTELIAAYGADPARWPAGERAAAEAALGARPDLARDLADALAGAAALDRALDSLGPEPVPAGLAERLLAAAPRAGAAAVVRQRSWLGQILDEIWPGAPVWAAAGACAASLALGVMLTVATPVADWALVVAGDTGPDVVSAWLAEPDDGLFDADGG